MISREVSPSEMPFAVKLRRCLERNGCVLAFEASEQGLRVGDVALVRDVLVNWTQLHVHYAEAVEELGDGIKRRFGPHVTFGQLVTPPLARLECVTVSRSGGVYVRHIVDYRIEDDTYIQRWDVIVRRSLP